MKKRIISLLLVLSVVLSLSTVSFASEYTTNTVTKSYEMQPTMLVDDGDPDHG